MRFKLTTSPIIEREKNMMVLVIGESIVSLVAILLTETISPEKPDNYNNR